MFTRPEVVTLTTWRDGHLLGLQARWVDAVTTGDYLAEIYCRRDPSVALWRLWKPTRDVVFARLQSSGEEMEFDTVADALSAIASYQVNQVRCAPGCHSEADAPLQ